MVGPGSRARCSSAKTPDWRRASLRNWRVSAGPVYPLPSDLEFTGGRFVPGIAGEIAHEQLHCYAFARRNVAGKRGIDVACGEGHRSALMAGVATVVTGIDVDTVVSFETIEHLPRAYQPRMLAEIARALAKDRVLIVLFGAAFTKTQLQARDGTVVPRNSAVLAGASSSSSISRLEHGAAAARGVPSPVEDGLRDPGGRCRAAGSCVQVLTTISSRPNDAASSSSFVATCSPVPTMARSRRRWMIERSASVYGWAAAASSDRSGVRSPFSKPTRQCSRVVNRRLASSLGRPRAPRRRSWPSAARGAHQGRECATVERESLLGSAAVGEEIRVRVRKPEVRRELRAVVGAAEDPDLRGRGALGQRADPPVRVPFGKRLAAQPEIQFLHLDGEALGGMEIGIERHRRCAIGAGRAAHAEVDAPGAIASSTRNCSATLSVE